MIIQETEISPLHAIYSFQNQCSEGILGLYNFQSFPKEWKVDIKINNSKLNLNIARELINFAVKNVSKKGGECLVIILEKKQIADGFGEIYQNLGFKTYFIDQHSKLDLTSFCMEIPLIKGIEIHSWSSLNLIDHKNPEYLQHLRELYQVEYDADYKIRETGRWDKYNPDPEEFVKRFTSGEASDDLMFVARDRTKIVGLIYPWIDEGNAGIFFTGTHPDYVNRNIATCLKIYLANELKKDGFTLLVTNNRGTNLAILKTNEKIGFKTTHQRLFLKRSLVED